MMHRICVLLFGLVALSLACAGDEKTVNDPQLPYQARRANPVTYEADCSFIVTAPYHTKTLRVWVPLPQSDAGQEVEGRTLTTFPLKVAPKFTKEPAFGNEFAYFEFDHPEGAQIIRHQFKIKVWELHWNLQPEKLTKIDKWPDRFDRYLRSDATVVVDERFHKLAATILTNRKSEPHDLAAAMKWVNENVAYDHVLASLQASSEHALDKKRGHCSDYHGLCAALGRAMGYPTRVTYGINTFPKNSPSHCKLEAFMPPYGWVSFDVSETQRMVDVIRKDTKLTEADRQTLTQAAVARLFRGFRDNTWFIQTRGTDYELVPPAKKRVPVVRTLYAEADGVALPDPDPANPEQRQFAWMTAFHITPDKQVTYPFKDVKSLRVKP